MMRRFSVRQCDEVVALQCSMCFLVSTELYVGPNWSMDESVYGRTGLWPNRLESTCMS
jgi:hypothetical protein